MMQGGQPPPNPSAAPIPEHDPLAEKFLDKLLPETRHITDADLKRMGIDPALHDQAQEIVKQLTVNGIKPTIENVVMEFRRRLNAARRVGI
jgi:hypothetical protein